MNETCIFCELEPNLYSIYKGGEQEDKDKHKQREPMIYYYKFIEPALLDDDNKTLQDSDIYDNELLLSKVELKLLLNVPCCRISTIYIQTDNTLKHIQEKTVELFNDKMNNNLKSKQISLFLWL